MVSGMQRDAADLEGVRDAIPRAGHKGCPGGRDNFAGPQRAVYGNSLAYDFPVSYKFFSILYTLGGQDF